MRKEPVIKQLNPISRTITPSDREMRIRMSYEEFLTLYLPLGYHIPTTFTTTIESFSPLTHHDYTYAAAISVA